MEARRICTSGSRREIIWPAEGVRPPLRGSRIHHGYFAGMQPVGRRHPGGSHFRRTCDRSDLRPSASYAHLG